MMNREFFEFTEIFKQIENQLKTQNLIQIVINSEKFDNFTEEELKKIKERIKKNC